MTLFEFINKYRVGIVIVLCVLSLVFICVGHIYRDQVQNVLKQELFKFPSCSIDWWSVSHFMLFSIFGFLIPSYPLTFFTLGLGFEFIEECLASDDNKKLVDCKDPANKEGNIICKFSINDGYWYMNPSDPWVNLTGYIVGSAIRTVLF
jgi:hypothetical protein